MYLIGINKILLSSEPLDNVVRVAGLGAVGGTAGQHTFSHVLAGFGRPKYLKLDRFSNCKLYMYILQAVMFMTFYVWQQLVFKHFYKQV